jgi:hypothetical protein
MVATSAAVTLGLSRRSWTNSPTDTIRADNFLQKIRSQAKLAPMNNPSFPHANRGAAVSTALSRRQKRDEKLSAENLV